MGANGRVASGTSLLNEGAASESNRLRALAESIAAAGAGRALGVGLAGRARGVVLQVVADGAAHAQDDIEDAWRPAGRLAQAGAVEVARGALLQVAGAGRAAGEASVAERVKGRALDGAGAREDREEHEGERGSHRPNLAPMATVTTGPSRRMASRS